MKILRTYILQEHLPPFFVTMGGLTAVLLIGNLIKFAELVIAKGVAFFDILRLILYLIPYMLSFTIPMACLIAMVLAFGRLSSDYELIAMRASGIAPFRLVSPLLAVGLALSLLLLFINDRVVPASHMAFRQQLKAIGLSRPGAYLEPGTFIKEFPPYVIFMYDVQGQRMNSVRIYEPQPGGPTRTIIADWGEFEPLPNRRGVQLKLYDGTVDEWDPLHPGSLYKASFTTYTMILHPDQEDVDSGKKKLKEMTFQELVVERRQLQRQGIETTPASIELHRKIASSFSPLVFMLFGLVFGLRLHQYERLTTYLWVLGIFIAYYLSAVGMNALVLKGWVPAWLAMWTPNFIGTGVGGVLVWRTLRQ